MKLHIITVGRPKLAYAQSGWQEYYDRLGHYHTLRSTHIANKHNDAAHLLKAAEGSYLVAMELTGLAMSSQKLAKFIEERALDGREVSFIIGGPDGLPPDVLQAANYQWRLSQLTLPHDLAMVVLLEALYRATTINAGLPYHK